MKTRASVPGARMWIVLWVVMQAWSGLAAATNLHCLWAVEGKSNTVYLLGSVHLLQKEHYPLAAPLENAFSNSAIAVFETDMQKINAPEAQQLMMQRAMLPPGSSLKDLVSPKNYEHFAKHVRDAGMPPGALDQFKPAMAAMVLTMMELQKLGVDPKLGIDRHFFDKARGTGKQIVPLETVEFQINLVTSFDLSDGELVMESALKDIDGVRTMYRDMVSAWQTGDSAKLDKFLTDTMRESPAIYKRLVTDRTAQWMSKVEELLRGNKNAVVIVGAGHLVGADGMVELLRKKGFKVRQL